MSRSNYNWVIWLFAGLMVFFIIFLVDSQAKRKEYLEKQPSGNLSKPPAKRVNKSLAYIMCEKMVAKKLKSPKTAEFASDWTNHVSYLGDGKYKINSYVDSQNSFGALVRSKFSCVMTDLGDSKWQISDVVFYE